MELSDDVAAAAKTASKYANGCTTLHFIELRDWRDRAAELENELAVHKRALDEAVGYPASDYPTYGGDYKEAKKGWTDQFLTKARKGETDEAE